MKKDDIIKLAQECQLIGMRPHLDGIYQGALELFATLVAAAEREACAEICESKKSMAASYFEINEYLQECADEIRERSAE